MFNRFFFFENPAFYEIMRKNNIEVRRNSDDNITLRRKDLDCMQGN